MSDARQVGARIKGEMSAFLDLVQGILEVKCQVRAHIRRNLCHGKKKQVRILRA